MQVMWLGDGRVSGIWLCSFHGYPPSRGFVLLTPYTGRHSSIGSMVSFTPYAITHMGSLRALLRLRLYGSQRTMGLF